MSAYPVTYYTIKCDNCGRIATADDFGGDFSAWEGATTATEMISADWEATETGHNCPECIIQAIDAMPCNMTHTPPFDFAQCDRHDTTFALGDVCKYHKRNNPDWASGVVL